MPAKAMKSLNDNYQKKYQNFVTSEKSKNNKKQLIMVTYCLQVSQHQQ